MGDQDRSQSDYELLSKSLRALEAEQKGDVPPAKLPTPDHPYRPADDDDDDDVGADAIVMMYRGRPVRRGSRGTQGAGSSTGRPKQFRGAGAGRGKRKVGRAADRNNLKAALAKLAELHAEGLITKAEFDSKRGQILNRL